MDFSDDDTFIDSSKNEIIIDISENYPKLCFNTYNESGINLMIALADLSYVINHTSQPKYANLLSQFKYSLCLDLNFLNNELKCNENFDNIKNNIPDNIQDFLLEFRNKNYSVDESSYIDDCDLKLKLMKKSFDEIASLSPHSQSVIELYCRIIYNDPSSFDFSVNGITLPNLKKFSYDFL
ncbi:hypothetical protein QJ850_gp042 [Acanthamoeba polyphaga mimivirus]|uniref:Uncharacterized protein n=1 Tax=Acanthamoeba polyphaga mimivirus Kroon TaxID=3069720 RepID=A0A0G2Y9Y8_9VIRU|nr:hypothetical protein QJ850_gp042 [Acanthamoeba polyphaga mimivirus]AKI80657.1 hypothetical protein [Acanthamoeba polyphaga mimivirus Kroon]